jgi:ferredoxin
LLVHVSVDRDLCEANGVCAGLEPAVFDLGDDDELTITQPSPPEELREQVELAVVRCPRQALTLTD